MKTALITGSSGQDGAHLDALLRSQGWSIVGISKNSETDLSNSMQVKKIIQEIQPDHVYHFAAFHHSSEEKMENDERIFLQSHETNVVSTLNFLETIFQTSRKTKFFLASSCLIFGRGEREVKDESSCRNPTCIYGFSKLQATQLCEFYRNKGVHASVGILFNHESSLRPIRFVSRKISRAVALIKLGRQKALTLGDLKAINDWSHAKDMVNAMKLVLDQKDPDTFVMGSGIAHSLKDFVETAFSHVDLDWKDYVQEDSSLLTRAKPPLIADPRKLITTTGWAPKFTFENMVVSMVDADMKGYE